MKAKIIKCSKDTYWYSGLVGEIFKVVEKDKGFLLTEDIESFTQHYIQKKDAEIVTKNNK